MDTHQLRADAEEFRMDTLPDQDSGMDIPQPTETVSSPDQPSGVVDTQGGLRESDVRERH